METINDRVKIIAKDKNLSQQEFAERIGTTQQYLSAIINNKRNVGINVLNKIRAAFPDVDFQWLLNGGEAKDPDVQINVNDAFELHHIENKNSNTFINLENGQYLMTMPLAEFNIQAGLLDHYQDIEYLQGLSKHSIIVDNPARGRYLAFRVKGDSMDSGRSDSILQNYIVATRELQNHHWTSKLKYDKFPYWVIYTTEARMPLLKQIIDHDTTTGMITCHSLNDSPEYKDFTLSLNDVQALFYVIDISRNVAKDNY